MKLASVTFKRTKNLTRKFPYICRIKKSFLAAASVNKRSKSRKAIRNDSLFWFQPRSSTDRMGVS